MDAVVDAWLEVRVCYEDQPTPDQPAASSAGRPPARNDPTIIGELASPSTSGGTNPFRTAAEAQKPLTPDPGV
jgi:hypothetical protein